MDESKVEQMSKLIEQWTRAEIMARFGRFDNLEYANFAYIQIDKANTIRELLFGTSDLVELGLKWGMLKKRDSTKEVRQKKGTIEEIKKLDPLKLLV